jgi:hypothetical protein
MKKFLKKKRLTSLNNFLLFGSIFVFHAVRPPGSTFGGLKIKSKSIRYV